MKVNYPIKYAIMPIIEQVGWYHGLNELESKYDIVCYIVSKCYLISDLTKYKEDGSVIKEYEVVFPYQLNKFGKWQRNIPIYNLMNGYCINANKVKEVFESYEAALDYAMIENKSLCEKSLLCLPFSENFLEKIKEKKNDFAEKLLEYKVLEQEILFHTEDIKIGENKKLDNVLKISNNSGRILSFNIYEILKIYNNDKFVVYSISPEQYNNLIKLINDRQTNNINSVIDSKQALVLHKESDDFVKLATEEICGAYYIENNSLNYDCKLDKVTDEDFENIDEDVIVFYTTETIKDLVNSYKTYSEIDLVQVQNSVLKKIKK